ncbi:MAG: hypothetical protein JW757_10040 [Anaerolineales bacterium]|nr:hypothetical protein [Anaerolineales bacterium]
MTTKKTILLLLIVLLAVSLACSLPALLQGGDREVEVVSDGRLPDGLTENYVPSLGYTPSNPFNYSPDQMSVINAHGNPTRFMIIFTVSNRQETWIYDTSGYTVVFRDGVKLSEKSETPQYWPEMYATTLGPNQFYQGMGVDEVVLSTGRADLTLVTLEGLEKESRLMYLQGLSVGLVDGRVNFVETIPAMTETLLRQEDFTVLAPPVEEPAPTTAPEPTTEPAAASSAFSLTPQEEALQGTHTYTLIIYDGGEPIDGVNTQIEARFEGSQLILVENGESSIFSRTGENSYRGNLEGTDIALEVTATGYQWKIEENGVSIEVVAIRYHTGSTQPASSLLVGSRTPEENLNSGEHQYRLVIFESREATESGSVVINLAFDKNTVRMKWPDWTADFTKFSTNRYLDNEDQVLQMVFTKNGFVWHTDDPADDYIAVFTIIP